MRAFGRAGAVVLLLAAAAGATTAAGAPRMVVIYHGTKDHAAGWRATCSTLLSR